MKPEIQIIASSNDGNPNYTYLIDPNPEKNVIFNPEDYFIYVNLTAYPKARTFINVDDFDVSNNGNNNQGLIQSLLGSITVGFGSSRQSGKCYANWTTGGTDCY